MVYIQWEAMVFGTDIFALCDAKGLVVTCDKKPSVKELFEKQRVGVDALNTSHHAGRQGPLSWAERRRNLGQRIIGLWLHGAKPVIIIDGPETAPGAGKYSQIDARARAHNPLTVVPTQDQDAFWDASQPWWSRDKLGDRFRRWRVEFAADCHVGASDATKKRLRKRVRDAAFPRRILDARSAPKALEWASGLFGGNLLPKKGEPGYAKIVQKFRDVRKLYDADSD